MPSRLPRIQKPPTSGEAEKIIARDVALMSRSYRRAFPMVVRRVSGSIVEDINGNAYIDFTSGLGTLPIGGNHPEVVKALREQLEKATSYTLMAAYSEETVDLAEELSRVAPIRGAVRALFCVSGSEAVDVAIKAMRWHSGKDVILTFIGEHHGSTAYSAALADEKTKSLSTKIFDTIYGFGHDCGNCPLELKPEKCRAKCLELSRKLVEAVAPEALAAVLFEPIHLQAGLSFPSAHYMESLMKFAKELGGLAIANELLTAPARVGRWFALDHWNIKVDAVCLGEQLASGLPLGVLLAREELLDLEPGTYESVAGGSQLSAAAALATLRAIREEGLIERSERIGRGILKRVRDTVKGLGLNWRVDGIGMLIGIRVLDERGLGDERLARLLVDECFRVGLLLWRRGTTILISPALNIEEELLESGLEIFEEKISDLSQLSQAS